MRKLLCYIVFFLWIEVSTMIASGKEDIRAVDRGTEKAVPVIRYTCLLNYPSARPGPVSGSRTRHLPKAFGSLGVG